MVLTEWLLAILYLIGGLNDLFLDVVYYVGPLRRWLAQGRENPTATVDELYAIPEKPIAILIPAWDESAVIGAMLGSTCDRIDYNNYEIFVGTYPNDDDTQMEVARAAFDRPRIHKVVCPNPGPTSKADCLNWIVEAIKLREQATGQRFEIFTLQDAEDVVHPLTLKVFNRFVPQYDMIQVPVVPFERPLYKLTGNTYLDEFAEVHLKNLDARLAVGGMVPSAGVGTAFGREACDELAAQTNHVLFPPVSLTEDYDFSFRLFRNGRRSAMARVWVQNNDNPDNIYDELVAIREFFPAIFSDAVRQKQRWMLGITFQGWEKLGWGNGWRERYILFRDRIGVLTSLMNAVTLFIVMRVSEAIVWSLAHHQAWNANLGQFHLPVSLRWFIDANLVLLAFRILQRALCVKLIARRRQMLMVPFRLVWGNVIDFYCTLHAIRRYTYSRLTGKPLKWLKTAHEFPNVESLLRAHRPLGDLLLERRLISPAQLSDALATQRWQRDKHSRLGEILLAMPALTEAELEDTLALQARSKVRVQEAAEAELVAEPIAARRDESTVHVAAPALHAEPIMLESTLPLMPEEERAVFFPEPGFVVQPEAVQPPLEVVEQQPEATEQPQPEYALEPVVELHGHEPDAAEFVFGESLVESHPAQAEEPAFVEALQPIVAELVQTEAVVAEVVEVPAAVDAAELAAPVAEAPIAEPVADVPEPSAAEPEPASPVYTVEPTYRPTLPWQVSKSNPLRAGQMPSGPAQVIPISREHRTPRRFSMLHSVASNWKSTLPTKRILVAIGTRPEAIKLAPLVRELQMRMGSQGGPEQVFVCATGQHQDMVEDALAGFGVKVDLNLNLMTPGQTLAAVSARILHKFTEVIEDFQPDWVVVQGDTATTAMAALAAFYAGVRVAHVEAGLRTRDLRQPFPEEFNRKMVGMFANIHFAATDWARQNLLREGVDENDIIVTGNTGIDALRSHCERIGLSLDHPHQRPAGYNGPVRVLVTAHRRENLEEGIANICDAIAHLLENEPGRYLFLWPLHPNPRVGEIARERLGNHPDMLLTGPAKYDELLAYLEQCDVVLTDSGGLQEEAPSFGKPVLILREKTERPEGVSAGMAWLVGTDARRIETAIQQLAQQIAENRTLRTPHNPYGDGFASQRIADYFSGRTVHEFGEAEERDEIPQRVPAGGRDSRQYQTVS